MVKKLYRYENTTPIAPGGSLGEAMKMAKVTPQMLAERTQTSTAYVQAVLAGEAAVTPYFAEGLAQVLTMPANFWLRYEANYQRAQAAQRQNQSDD